MPRKNQRGREFRLPLAWPDRLGLMRSISFDDVMFSSARRLPPATVIGVGTSCAFSSRFCAVTTTSDSALPVSSSAGGGAGASTGGAAGAGSGAGATAGGTGAGAGGAGGAGSGAGGSGAAGAGGAGSGAGGSGGGGSWAVADGASKMSPEKAASDAISAIRGEGRRRAVFR